MILQTIHFCLNVEYFDIEIPKSPWKLSINQCFWSKTKQNVSLIHIEYRFMCIVICIESLKMNDVLLLFWDCLTISFCCAKHYNGSSVYTCLTHVMKYYTIATWFSVVFIQQHTLFQWFNYEQCLPVRRLAPTNATTS